MLTDIPDFFASAFRRKVSILYLTALLHNPAKFWNSKLLPNVYFYHHS